MTLAAMRYQVDVEALQSEKMTLAGRCDHENEAKQQLRTTVGLRTTFFLKHSVYFDYFISSSVGSL